MYNTQQKEKNVMERMTRKDNDSYIEKGFIDKSDYHEHLSEKFCLNLSAIESVSKFLGEKEDFNKLPKVLNRIVNPEKVFSVSKRSTSLRTRVKYSEID